MFVRMVEALAYDEEKIRYESSRSVRNDARGGHVLCQGVNPAAYPNCLGDAAARYNFL